MATKKCPLTYHVQKGTYDQEVGEISYCEEDQCAWWDDFTGHCAILSISRHGGEGSFDVVKKESKGE